MMALDAVIRVAARLVLFLVAASLLSEAFPVQAQPEVEWPAVRVVQRWSGFTKPLDVFLARATAVVGCSLLSNKAVSASSRLDWVMPRFC